MTLVMTIADIICKTLLDSEALGRARTKPGAFTRNCKKLPFGTVIKILMQCAKRSVSSVLDELFLRIARECKLQDTANIQCSHQAFSKARAGISHSIFQECFENILDFLCNPETLENQERLGGLWGIQPIAIDGTKTPLPNRKALLAEYGGMGRDCSSPTAIASTAFDMLRGITLDAAIEPLNIDGRTLAIRHLKHIKEKSRANLMYTMFIFDRGYASKGLFKFIENDRK